MGTEGARAVGAGVVGSGGTRVVGVGALAARTGARAVGAAPGVRALGAPAGVRAPGASLVRESTHVGAFVEVDEQLLLSGCMVPLG